jgi:uncharacterized protein YecE (DUF72 family)
MSLHDLYFRLHGGPCYRHRCSEEELERLKEKVREKETYVLFNDLNIYQAALGFDHLMELDKYISTPYISDTI